MFGGYSKQVVRVVELGVDLEARQADAFGVAPLFEKRVARCKHIAHSRRWRRFLAELREDWEGVAWAVGQPPLMKGTTHQTSILSSEGYEASLDYEARLGFEDMFINCKST